VSKNTKIGSNYQGLTGVKKLNGKVLKKHPPCGMLYFTRTKRENSPFSPERGVLFSYG
jgi:hypothetical protein